jgi:hypothetical protein
MAHHVEEQSNLKVGLLGAGIGLVWILIVATIAYNLAAH